MWIAVGCAVSLACDWAFFVRLALVLRQVQMPDQFTYADSLLIRKASIGAVGGLLAFSSVRDDATLIAVAISLWLIFHFAIYVEWYRFARRATTRTRLTS